MNVKSFISKGGNYRFLSVMVRFEPTVECENGIWINLPRCREYADCQLPSPHRHGSLQIDGESVKYEGDATLKLNHGSQAK